MSFINDTDAILYQNGENVYVWKIIAVYDNSNNSEKAKHLQSLIDGLEENVIKYLNH